MSPKARVNFSRPRSVPDADEVDTQAAILQERENNPRLAARPAEHGQMSERIPVTRVLPDPFQARRVIPTPIADRFFAGQMDCLQAAQEWLDLANSDMGARMRLNELLPLANSIRADGQINSVKGVWEVANDDGGAFFRLESGERRFWALVINWAMDGGREEAPRIKAESVPAVDRFRQINENLRTSQYTAVGRACAFAEALLTLLGVEPLPGQTTYGYCRGVQNVRVPGKVWEELDGRIGLGRTTLVTYFGLLDFPDELLDLADQYQLPLRALIDIRSAPQEEWEARMVNWIDQNLDEEQMQAVQQGAKLPGGRGPITTRQHPADPAEKLARKVKAAVFGRGAANPPLDVQHLAESTLIELGSDPVRLQRFIEFLDEWKRGLVNSSRK